MFSALTIGIEQQIGADLEHGLRAHDLLEGLLVETHGGEHLLTGAARG